MEKTDEKQTAAAENRPKKTQGRFSQFIFGLFFFFLLRLDSLLFSIPVWVLLLLHFTSGLDIKWFLIALGAFFLIGLLRYLLILFGRWGGNSEEPKKENKNPYSGL